MADARLNAPAEATAPEAPAIDRGREIEFK
jgi:hypothetical protein